jgi:5'-3' exonuclease
VYKGKKLGIDILGFLYRAKSRRHSTLVYVARLVAAFRKHHIQPVPVFDGKPPDEKQPLLEDRAQQRVRATLQCKRLEHDLLSPGVTDQERAALVAEIQRLTGATTYFTGEERELVKQLFYICGVKPLNASGEADNTLAYLSRCGDLAAVISHDMDLLARGVETLLVPDAYALPGDASGWSSFSRSALCKASGLSDAQFVDLCVLIGSDYTHGLPRLPPHLAHSLLFRHGDLLSVLRARGIRNTAPYERAAHLLKGTDDTPASLMNENQWEKWRSPSGDPEWEALFALRGTLLHCLADAEFRDLCSPIQRL